MLHTFFVETLPPKFSVFCVIQTQCTRLFQTLFLRTFVLFSIVYAVHIEEEKTIFCADKVNLKLL